MVKEALPLSPSKLPWKWCLSKKRKEKVSQKDLCRRREQEATVPFVLALGRYARLPDSEPPLPAVGLEAQGVLGLAQLEVIDGLCKDRRIKLSNLSLVRREKDNLSAIP